MELSRKKTTRILLGAWRIALSAGTNQSHEASDLLSPPPSALIQRRHGRPPRFVLQTQEGYQAPAVKEQTQSGQVGGWRKWGEGWPIGSALPTKDSHQQIVESPATNHNFGKRVVTGHQPCNSSAEDYNELCRIVLLYQFHNTGSTS